jgi:hypothetical protein
VTGFSAEWLALREPADHAARNRDVLSATSRLFAGRDRISVVDLGSGSGSNLRGLAPHLPPQQRWRLVDYDPALIAAAKTALSCWSDRAASVDGGLCLQRDGRIIDVAFVQVDLSAGVEELLDVAPDLVTAAAFFDLVSAGWIERFVATLAARRLPLYTVLIYNGEERWEPDDPSDQAVNAAFNLHQRTDKGFGPAAGPAAAGILAESLRRNGYEVILGDSPWRLSSADGLLIGSLAAGIAEAVDQTGHVAPEVLQSWRETRRACSACTIGHTDLLAVPRDNYRLP